jgi:hypothetical protein
MQIISSGVLSRSEAATARANLTFPNFVTLSNGDVLANWRAGSSKDGVDEHLEFSRSTDGGTTWSEPFSPIQAPRMEEVGGTLKIGYLTEITSGRLMGVFMWVDRETYPGHGSFNADTEGCLPTRMLLAESDDFGASWSAARDVPMPEEIGPPSLTNPLIVLADGTLVLSVESNKTYHDAGTWFQRVVIFHSSDQGRTWGEPAVAGFDPSGRIRNWDQRLGMAPDGRLGAFLWTFDSHTDSYLNIHRRTSADGGHTWSQAEDLGFTDQAAHPAILPDGRVVFPWVDRFNTHSIRARLAPAIDAAFDPNSELVVYEHRDPNAGEAQADGALGLSVWSFGLPYADLLPNGDVLVVYYAGSEAAMDIHWARLGVS